MIFELKIFTIAVLCTLAGVYADTPANCTYEDVRGIWTFYEGPRGYDKKIDCTSFKQYSTKYTVLLEFPNTAIDLDGNVGYWTIIYNQGFEVVINHRKYFAFSYYEQEQDNVTSYCDKTFSNSSHNTGVNPDNWSCYYGVKDKDENSASMKKFREVPHKLETLHERRLFQKNQNFIDSINKKQKSWTAKHYDFMSEMTIADLVRMAGGKNTRNFIKPKPAKVTREIEAMVKDLPESFDWRNVNGVNYVSPVRNQGACGSCYAFGSLGMHEARLRIRTNNTQQTIYSTQDIVECSSYSQGCDGGFPYLIAGKYAEDYGLVAESCNPYKGKNGQCSTDESCKRQYATNYEYIGGFYGACNEALMRLNLVKNGPVTVAFEVYDDFMQYSGGIYHHTFLKDRKNFGFSPFELTNHAVLAVGYGVDSTSGEKYWIVKNSWSESWGEKGYFRIRRGSDECAIESIAVQSTVVV